MSVPSDVVPAPASPAFQAPPYVEPTFEPGPEEATAHTYREINARRAQLENPEMLRRLRGL